MWPFKKRRSPDLDAAISTMFTKEQGLLLHAVNLCGEGRFDEAMAVAKDPRLSAEAKRSITEMAQLGLDMREADKRSAR